MPVMSFAQSDVSHKNQNQNVHLFDPHTIYIIAILTLLLIKQEVDPETPAKTSLVANA